MKKVKQCPCNTDPRPGNSVSPEEQQAMDVQDICDYLSSSL